MLNPAYSKFTGIGDDLDKDSLPDTWEFKELLTTSFKGFEDPDKDGYSNWNEWKNNTDPYIFNNTTSIFDLLESSDLFVIQENPFRDFISIKLKNISKHLNVELMLFDINGNMLERILYSGNETNIRLNTVFLNAGSYLVCCRIPSTKQVQYQLVLKH
jgi:hypothetical protein